MKLKKGRVATDLRQHFFSERVINTWNHLDAAVIEAETINTFKSRLQKLHDKVSQCLDVIRALDSRGRASPLGRPRPVRHPVR